jgi:hypothetical protein
MFRVSLIYTRRADPRTLLGDHTVQTTVQAKVQREQKWLRLLGPFFHPRNLQLATLLLLNPPWQSITLSHKIPSHLRALYTHHLEILTFHYTCTQLWNQAHNRHRLSPFQHRLILSQKCRPSGEKLGEFFQEEEDLPPGVLKFAVRFHIH